MRAPTALAAATAVLLLAFPVRAVTGWQVDEVDADFPDDPVRYYFGGASVRIENLVVGLTYLLDLEAGTVHIVDAAKERYAGGHVREVKKELEGHMASRRGSGKSGGPEERAGAVISEVRIEKLPGGRTVAGFSADGYRILLGDLLVEEVWLAPDIDAVRAGAGGTLFHMMEAVTGGKGGVNDEFPPDYEKARAYRSLVSAGYPVRRTRYYLDVESLTEVVRAERRELPEELFAVPAGYEPAGYIELFSGSE